MRDRREVLKLLAGGTAAAAGASLITTSTAFADFGTVKCQPTSATFPSTIADVVATTAVVNSGGNQNDFVRITVTTAGKIANIACPVGFTKSLQYRWTVVTGTADIVADASPTVSIAGAWGSTTTVRVVTAGQTVQLNDGTYAVRLDLRALCTSGAKKCWKCIAYQVDFGWDREQR